MRLNTAQSLCIKAHDWELMYTCISNVSQNCNKSISLSLILYWLATQNRVPYKILWKSCLWRWKFPNLVSVQKQFFSPAWLNNQAFSHLGAACLWKCTICLQRAPHPQNILYISLSLPCLFILIPRGVPPQYSWMQNTSRRALRLTVTLCAMKIDSLTTLDKQKGGLLVGREEWGEGEREGHRI